MTSKLKSRTPFPKTQTLKTSSRPSETSQQQRSSYYHSSNTTLKIRRATFTMIKIACAFPKENSEPKSSMTIMMPPLQDTKASNEPTQPSTKCSTGLE